MIILLLKIRIKIYVVVSSSFDAESEHSHEAGDENDRVEYFGHYWGFEERAGKRRGRLELEELLGLTGQRQGFYRTNSVQESCQVSKIAPNFNGC